VSSQGDEGIIDVERRKTQVEYTLGDPTVFPPEFLNWLKRFIEQSGITLPASAIFGSLVPGGASGSLLNIAAGVIVPFGGAVAPAGSIPCNGQTALINDYPKLHDIIGATWGPQTATTFTIPDLRDRTLFGAGSFLLAATDGLAAGSRGPLHRHTVTDPGHAHSGAVMGNINNPPNGNILIQDGGSPERAGTAIGMGSSGTGISVGPAGKPLNGPAYAIVNYVITTG